MASTSIWCNCKQDGHCVKVLLIFSCTWQLGELHGRMWFTTDLWLVVTNKSSPTSLVQNDLRWMTLRCSNCLSEIVEIVMKFGHCHLQYWSTPIQACKFSMVVFVCLYRCCFHIKESFKSMLTLQGWGSRCLSGCRRTFSVSCVITS